jgi:phosphatidylglycerol:prolipoprotein diacylglycerol transferase
MDAVAPSIAIGTLFGRLGCFLNGCCYGDPCRLPWAVSFPEPSPPWAHHRALGLIPPGAMHSLPVHPTQLYAALDGFIILLLLSAFYPLRRRDGEVIGLLMVTYPITRFLIEFLRNDEGVFFAGLTISQNISVALFAAGCVYLAWLSKRPAVLYRDQVDAGKPHGALPLAAARA